MSRLSAVKFRAGASAYDWKTRRPSKWHPDPIEDVEDFCRRHLDRALAGWGMFLREEDISDTVQELIIAVWKLEERFDPDKAASFSAYSSWIISQRAVDFGPRRILGRHGTRAHNHISSSEEYEGNRMGESIDGFSMDDQNDRESDLRGILDARSDALARKTHELGVRENGRSEKGYTEF